MQVRGNLSMEARRHLDSTHLSAPSRFHPNHGSQGRCTTCILERKPQPLCITGVRICIKTQSLQAEDRKVEITIPIHIEWCNCAAILERLESQRIRGTVRVPVAQTDEKGVLLIATKASDEPTPFLSPLQFVLGASSPSRLEAPGIGGQLPPVVRSVIGGSGVGMARVAIHHIQLVVPVHISIEKGLTPSPASSTNPLFLTRLSIHSGSLA